MNRDLDHVNDRKPCCFITFPETVIDNTFLLWIFKKFLQCRYCLLYPASYALVDSQQTPYLNQICPSKIYGCNVSSKWETARRSTSARCSSTAIDPSDIWCVIPFEAACCRDQQVFCSGTRECDNIVLEGRWLCVIQNVNPAKGFLCKEAF